MTTEPIDHAARLLSAALNLAEQLPASMNLEDSLSAIQAYSTLALAQAQDRANELQEQAIEQQKIANLFEHEHMRIILNERAGGHYHGPSLVWDHATSETGSATLKPSIASALGLGGESDGE